MANIEGFTYAYGWNVYYQDLYGLWTIKDEGSIKRQRAWLWVFVMLFFIWIPQLAGLPFMGWSDLNTIIDCLSVNMSAGVAIAKIIVLRLQRRVIGSILATIADDWNSVETKNEIEVMLETARISRLISIVSFSIANFLFLEYVCSQVWIVAKNDKNTTMDPRLATDLVYVSYFPFNTTNRLTFASVWLGQLFGTLIGINCYSGPDSLISMMVLHLCGQLRIISESLKNIVDDTTIQEPERYWQRLSAIVKRHEQLILLAFVLRDVFSSILLVEMLACSVTFCFQGYVMFTTLMDRNGVPIPVLDLVYIILYGIDSVVHLFFYCYVGDILLIESTSISDNFYKSKWYNLAPKEAKAFLFVCHRSKAALEIKAGKFCTFNLQLFTVIMKSSMGYLSMLLAMKERLID